MPHILKKYVQLLHTKGDKEAMLHKMEDSQKNEYGRSPFQHTEFSCLLRGCGKRCITNLSVQENHQKAIADHNAQVPSLWSHIDDLEDRHHQNNIHIRGMPEVIQQEDLLPTVTSIIKTLLRNGPNCH